MSATGATTSPASRQASREARTQQLWHELARGPRPQGCCRRVAATMLLRWQLAGPLARRGATMQLRCANHPVASRLAGLLETTSNPARPTMLTVPVAGWQAALRRVGLLDHAGRPRQGLPPATVAAILGARDCDPATAWHTAILTGGELASSPRAGPTLSVACPDLTVALVLVRAARRLGASATLPSGGQQEHALKTAAPVTITVRRPQGLEQLLHRLGAPQSAATLTLPPAPPPAQSNRERGGLDTSNRARAVSAARHQTEQVRAALAAVAEHASPGELAAGRLRLAHPGASLTELGQLADPPVGKDILAGRLRRLLTRAQRHRTTR